MKRKRYYRSRNDALLGGVCGGLGCALGIRPAWLRLGFVLLGMYSVAGWLFYLLLWLMMSPDGDLCAVENGVAWAGSQARMIVGASLLGAGMLLFSSQLDLTAADAFQWYPLWPFLLICIGGLAIWRMVNEQ